MVQVKYTSFSKHLLFSYKKYLIFLFLKLNSSLLKYKFITLPTKKKKKTFLKSPHVNKKAKENFEHSIYSFTLLFNFNLNFLKQLKYNVPKNIHIKILFFNI